MCSQYGFFFQFCAGDSALKTKSAGWFDENEQYKKLIHEVDIFDT